MDTITLPAELVGDMLTHMQRAGLTVKKAVDEVAAARSREKAASAGRDAVLEKLVAAGQVGPQKRAAAADMLSTHDGALEMIVAMSDLITEQRRTMNKQAAADTGTGVDPAALGVGDVAGTPAAPPSYLGQRSSFVQESDKPLMRLIGR